MCTNFLFLFTTGTNTYIIGTGNRKVLIDCGDGQPGYVPLLIKSLQSINPDAYISDIFISHCHNDHWGGLPDILASELNSPPPNESNNSYNDISQHILIHKYPLAENTRLYKFFHKQAHKLPDYTVFSDLQDNQIIKIDEETHLRVVHTPGHAKDHCAFYLEEEDTVFTADCILGHGSVAFEDLTEYMYGLQKIKDLNPVNLFPGHGQEVLHNAIEKVDQYISLREVKEKQILEILLRDINSHMSSLELTTVMNTEANKQYHEHLLFVVVRTVGLHLIKLYYDGKVELVEADKFKQRKGLDPYDSQNVMNIIHEKWRYIGELPPNKDSRL